MMSISWMQSLQPFLILIAVFGFLTLAARQVGLSLSKYKLPLISGYLIAGIIIGPYALNLISASSIQNLSFIDDVALAFIAFSAGNELYIKEIRPRIVSISWITVGIALIGGAATFFAFKRLEAFIPFMANLDDTTRLVIAIVSVGVVISLSPAATIAVISELRAKGPLAKTAVGVSVVADVVVIVGFAISLSVGATLLSGTGFDMISLLFLVGELAISFLLGWIFGRVLTLVMKTPVAGFIKTAVILASGYGIFALSHWLAHYTHEVLHREIHLESLLICLIATYIVTNHTPYRSELTHLLEYAAPKVYLAFFTLTGIALELDVLFSVWLFALAIVAIRAIAVMFGAFTGGLLAREPFSRNLVGWMPYITQAGVGLGLAKSLGDFSPTWGLDLASLLIGVIVINQLIGPPLFKFALDKMGETHTKANAPEVDGVRDVLILGIEDQSLALARDLKKYDWSVTLVEVDESERVDLLEERLDNIYTIHSITPGELEKAGIKKTDVLLAMLPDDNQNYSACEIAFEHFGTPRMIVRMDNPSSENIARFRELGVRIVNPQTAMLSLLNQFVRSPAATTLLLGLDDEQRVEDITVRNEELHGMTLRDLRLPTDVLILSLRRNGHILLTHGYTQLERSDRVSVVGSAESLNKVRLLFA
jgi:Trk K+ transport system NAD-binding subunit/Kef-type K+ transport system membrane component KefB